MKEVREIDSELRKQSYERELELCKKLGGDIELYRRLSFNMLQLEQIRLGLEHGVDIEKYLDPALTWMEMESTRIQLESGIDMSKYTEQGYSWQQCTEIQIGLQEGLDVSRYDKRQFFSQQMQEIRYGLENKVDVSFYTDPNFDWMQMKEIRLGLEKGIDVSRYADKKYKYSVMSAIRKGLEKGRDIVSYADKGYDGKILREMNRGLDAGNKKITDYVQQGYHSGQLEQINNAFEAGVDLEPYLSEQFHGAQLQEIVKGLKKELDVSRYAQRCYNWFQMREIRFGMEDKINTALYENPDFSANQMAEIRKGIIAGLDVSSYAKIYFDPEQMAEKRQELELMNSAEMDDDVRKILEGAEDESFAELDEQERLEAENASREEEPENRETGQQDSSGEAAQESGQSAEKKEPKKPKKPKVIIDDMLLDACVTIAEDKMKATVCLELLESMAESLEVPDIMRALRHLDIKQGIKKENIVKMLKDKEYNKEVVVAEGKLPTNGDDGKFVFHFRTKVDNKPKLLEDGSVDFKNMDLFEMVKKDQLIAEYIPATAGAFGFDVMGNLTSPLRGKELAPIHGKGFYMSEDRKQYFSEMDGIIEMPNEGKIEIRNVYVVRGDVDVSTGNVSFDGDIQVTGSVMAGFIVSASGNVIVDGSCEGGTILSGKDIILGRGCQGQNVGRLEADGSVTGKFFESVQIVAGGNVTASYILNSDVKAEGKLLVEGRRGLILGGYVCGKQGITCLTLGNVAEVRTTVEVGIDKNELQDYQEMTKKAQKIDEEIETCEKALEKFMAQPEKDDKVAMFCEQLTKAIYSQKLQKKELAKKRKDVANKMVAQKNARIIIRGTVYPNCRIIMNSEAIKVRDARSNVQFVKSDDKKIDMVNR